VSEQSTPKQTRAQKREERRAAKEAVQAQELAKVRQSEVEAAERHKALMQRQTGRPSEYTQEQADSLCAWVAQGHSLRSWCRQNDREPMTVYRWLREHKDFFARYSRAHEDRADSLADEIVEIADESQFGTLEQIQAARLRIDARKWIAAKLRPQKWGDYQPVEQRSNVTFNIGISRLPHSVGHTIDAKPLIPVESTPDK
jgi:hypothetical protein